MKLGAQLYTVRKHTRNLDDFAETLKKVADIGYESVQVSGTCSFEPEWLDENLKKNGLVCACTHTSKSKIVDEPEQVAKDHKIFGCNVAGIGAAPSAFKALPLFGYQRIFDKLFRKKTDDGELHAIESSYESFVKDYRSSAHTLKENGVLFGYHNHSFEFQKLSDGKTIFEHILDDFPKDELTFILDTYWVQVGGGNPAEYIEKIAGQAHCIHVKDLAIVNNSARTSAIGDGNINFEAVLNACEKAGTQFILVEQDYCFGEDPFSCLARSFSTLKSLGM